MVDVKAYVAERRVAGDGGIGRFPPHMEAQVVTAAALYVIAVDVAGHHHRTGLLCALRGLGRRGRGQCQGQRGDQRCGGEPCLNAMGGGGGGELTKIQTCIGDPDGLYGGPCGPVSATPVRGRLAGWPGRSAPAARAATRRAAGRSGGPAGATRPATRACRRRRRRRRSWRGGRGWSFRRHAPFPTRTPHPPSRTATSPARRWPGVRVDGLASEVLRMAAARVADGREARYPVRPVASRTHVGPEHSGHGHHRAGWTCAGRRRARCASWRWRTAGAGRCTGQGGGRSGRRAGTHDGADIDRAERGHGRSAHDLRADPPARDRHGAGLAGEHGRGAAGHPAGGGGGKGSVGVPAHAGLAVTAEGRPPGPRAMDADLRDAPEDGSQRWTGGPGRAREPAAARADTRVVSVRGRGGGFRQLPDRAAGRGDTLPARAGRSGRRRVRTPDGGEMCLRERAAALPAPAVPEPAIPASGGPGARKGRVARPGIRAAEVTVMPPGEEEGRVARPGIRAAEVTVMPPGEEEGRVARPGIRAAEVTVMPPGEEEGRVARPGIRAAEVTVMPPGEEEGRAEPPRWLPLASGRPQPGVADAVHAAEVPGRHRGRWTVETWSRTPGPAPGSGTAGPAPPTARAGAPPPAPSPPGPRRRPGHARARAPGDARDRCLSGGGH